MVSRIKNIVGLILQGKTFKDKFILLIFYIFSFPINKVFKRKLGLLSPVRLEHEGGVFYVDDYNYLGRSSKDYEPEVLKELLSRKGNFIDVGSCIGFFSIHFANLGRKVISIEPEKRSFEKLKRNIQENKLKSIITLNMACSNKKGKTTFYVMKEDFGGSSLIQRNIHEGKILVDTDTLDHIVKKHGFHPEIIKIDVEGTEIDVLKGASKTIKKCKPVIVFECYGAEKYQEIEDFFMKREYTIRRLDYLNYVAYPKK